MNKIFINSGSQALKANGAEKIDLITFAEFKPGMFDAGIISNFGMQKKQSFISFCILDPENDILPDPQVAAAMWTNVMVLHDEKGIESLWHNIRNRNWHFN